MLVGWDTLDAPTYRHEAFAAYQSGREFDAELLEQLDVLPEFVAACGFANAKAAGYEADDFLAAAVARGGAARRHRDRGERRPRRLPARLASDDHRAPGAGRRDGAHRPGGGARTLRRRAAAGAGLHRAAGRPVRPAAGGKGVGPKSAASLLRKYGTLDDALADGRFAMWADELRLYRRIATMDASAPLPSLRSQGPTWGRAAGLAREWELNRLGERLDALAEGAAR